MSGEKKSGKNTGREKESPGKISSGKNLVPCKKLFPDFFPRLFSQTFGDGNFRTDYNICSELPFVGGYCHEENSRLV